MLTRPGHGLAARGDRIRFRVFFSGSLVYRVCGLSFYLLAKMRDIPSTDRFTVRSRTTEVGLPASGAQQRTRM
jgi:hypothetical protein